jgi:hypothetical protein
MQERSPHKVETDELDPQLAAEAVALGAVSLGEQVIVTSDNGLGIMEQDLLDAVLEAYKDPKHFH